MKIRSDLFCLDHRDDISLRIITLLQGCWEDYAAFLEETRKCKSVDRSIAKLKKFYRSVRRHGVKEPVRVWKSKTGQFYPLAGAHRIAAAYAANCKGVPIQLASYDKKAGGERYMTGAKRFADVSADTIRKLETRRKIMSMLDGMSSSGEKRFGKRRFSYHAVPTLSILGQRNCKVRAKELLDELPLDGERVLDIGSNMGMMSIELSSLASSVVGIEPASAYCNIARVLSEFHGATDVDFVNLGFQEYIATEPPTFDLILACAVSAWVKLNITSFMRSCCTILSKGGMVLFETHRNPEPKNVLQQIQKAGLRTKIIARRDSRMVILCRS
jgi:2-polyprenyl-3-methyl-5-hydroxy-6-metoxy-1,4-benzoquinol methylase